MTANSIYAANHIPVPAMSSQPTTPALPGILWVNADVIQPSQLSRADFNTWYCDDHIHDVVSKSGISSAARYEFVEDGSTPDRKLNFLTHYTMPDINFMESEEFRTLEGQRPGPNRERIFRNCEFWTRSYEVSSFPPARGHRWELMNVACSIG